MRCYESRVFYASLGLVVILHVVLLATLMVSFQTKKMPAKAPSRVSVQTIQLTPRNEQVKQSPAFVPIAEKIQETPELKPVKMPEPEVRPKKEAPPKTAKVSKEKKKDTPAKAPKNPPAKKEPAKKVAPPPKTPAIDPKKQALLAKAQASMSKIQSPTLTKKPMPAVPQADRLLAYVDKVARDEVDPDDEYQQALKQVLKLMLTLPEPGRVIVDLTLDRTGKVKKVSFSEGGGSVNRKYLEKMLPTLQLPAFGVFFKGVEAKTFRLELHGD